MEIIFLMEKIILHVPFNPFQGAKVDSGQKLTHNELNLH